MVYREVSMQSIPGFEGKYLICKEGIVVNNKGHLIKEIETMQGTSVELYHLGQREIIPIKTLLERTFHDNT